MEEQASTKEVRKRLETLWWGAAILWAGIVFGAEALEILPEIGDADAWSWVFLGVGLFSIAGALYRVSSTDYPNPSTWDWAWAGIFTILGIGGFTTLNIAWPLILILVGGAILFGLFFR
jgi:hypothetical protein